MPQLSVGQEFAALLTAIGVPSGAAQDEWFTRLTALRAAGNRATAFTENPYVGLRAFEQSDAARYFGRADLTARLIEQVTRNDEKPSSVIVVGPSGSGKSSLLRAGLLPAVGPSILFTPGFAPEREWDKRRTGIDKATVVVIDQVEQLFTLCPDDKARAAFLDAVSNWSGPVVFGLRADFYDRALEHPRLAVLLRKHQIIVEPMSVAELRAVIVEPANAAGLGLQDGLVDLLLRDSEGATGVLPLLSHTMRTVVELAQRQDPARSAVTIDDYRAAGGIQGAVARSADGAYQGLSAERQSLARNMFLRLVATGDGIADARRRVTFDELLGGRPTAEADVLVEVLDLFVTRRLLTTDVDAVEISHEALLTAWPLLQHWLAEDRIGHHIHGRLTAAARVWRDNDRRPEDLYRGGPLETAAEWAVEHGPREAINPLEREFLDASIAHRSALLRAERRRVRRRYQVISAALVLMIVAAGTGFYARQVTVKADHDGKVALSRQIAGKAIRLREKDPALAAQLALTAYRTAPTAEARSALLDSSAIPLPRRAHTAAASLSIARSLLATGTAAGAVQLYQTDDRKADTPIGRELRLDGPVDVVALSADATLLAAGTRNGTVAAWRITGASPPVLIPIMSDRATRVFGIAFSPDNKFLAVGTADATTRFWRLDAIDAPPLALTGPRQAVKSVAFSPAGDTLAAGSDDGTVHLWNVSANPQPTPLPTLTGPTSKIYSIAISPDGHTLAAGTGAEHVVYTWDITNPARPSASGAPLTGPASWVNTVTFSPDSTTLAGGSSDTKLWRWDLRTRQVTGTLPHPAPLTTVAYRDANTITTTTTDASTRTWTLPGPLLTGSTNQVFSTTFSAAGDHLLVGAGDHSIRLWNLSDAARPVSPYPPLTNAPSLSPLAGSSALSPDGTLAVGGTADGTIVLWSLTDPLRPIRLGSPAHVGKGTVQSIVFSPDGTMLAVTSDEGTAHLLDIQAPERPITLSTIKIGTMAFGVRFSPDGRQLAVASSDGNGTLWDITNRAVPALRYTATGFAGSVYSVAFSPDGKLLAFGGADYTVHLVDLTPHVRPEPIGRLTGPVGEIYDITFQPNSSMLAVASIDRTIWLWDLGTPSRAELVATLSAADDGLFTAAFSSDGHTLTAGGRDNAVRLWNVDPDSVARWICAAAGDPLTRAEWDQFIEGLPYASPC